MKGQNRTRRARLAALLLAGVAAAPAPALADGPSFTVIVPDTAARTTLGTVIAVEDSASGQGQAVFVGGGTLAGDNLFHSFAQFDLTAGDAAVWMPPGEGAIANVINRVTGNLPSQISGTIDTTLLPGADFWFINPNGVILGAGVRLDVPGASVFAAASDLHFADGAVFSARAADGSTLSMASPVAFGFLGGEGDIALSGARDSIAGASGSPRLSLVAPNLALTDNFASLGGLELVASGDAPIVSFADIFDGAANGAVAITSNYLKVLSGEAGAGDVVIAAGDLVMDNARLETMATGPEAAGSFAILASHATTMLNAGLVTSNQVLPDNPDPGGPGAIRIFTGDFTGDHAYLESYNEGWNDAGPITIDASGSIVQTGSIFVTGPGTWTVPRFISSLTYRDGAAASVFLEAQGGIGLYETAIVSTTQGLGAGGDISIVTPGLFQVADTTIEADSLPLDSQAFDLPIGGAGGRLAITAGEGMQLLRPDFFASTFTTGAGGDIELDSDGAIAITGGRIVAESAANPDRLNGESGGQGGSIRVSSQAALSIAEVVITSSAFNTARGGDIFLEGATGLTMTGGEVRALTTGSGIGGNIELYSPGNIAVTGTRFQASTFASGNAGSVTLDARKGLTITDAVIESNAERTDATGDAGGISVFVGGAASIANSRITADTRGTGSGGYVGIDIGGNLRLTDSEIYADTYGAGQGGYVELTVGGDAVLKHSSLTTESLSQAVDAGSGGYLQIDTGGALSLDASTVSARTAGAGAGGFIDLESAALNLAGGSAITANADGSGSSGLIDITTGALDLVGSTIATSTTGTGEALGLLISAGTLRIGAGGLIEAQSKGSGAAGFVFISTDAMEIVKGGAITTSAKGSGLAGSIVVEGGSVLIDGTGADGSASRIVSENTYQGLSETSGNAAGNIVLTASRVTVSNGGQINTNSDKGNAGLISITLAGADRPGSILWLRGTELPGTITTSSFGGRGGTGDAGMIVINGAYAVIAQGSAIAASGRTDSAFVTINEDAVRINSSDRANIVDVDGFSAIAPEQDVSSGTVVKEISFVDAAGVLEGRCAAAREEGRASRLDIREIGPHSVTEVLRPPLAGGGGNTCREAVR